MLKICGALISPPRSLLAQPRSRCAKDVIRKNRMGGVHNKPLYSTLKAFFARRNSEPWLRLLAMRTARPTRSQLRREVSELGSSRAEEKKEKCPFCFAHPPPTLSNYDARPPAHSTGKKTVEQIYQKKSQLERECIALRSPLRSAIALTPNMSRLA